MRLKLPNRSCYARAVEGVDPRHNNGWAVAGHFLKAQSGAVETDASLVLVVDRDAREAWLYRSGNRERHFLPPFLWSDVATILLELGAPTTTVTPISGGKRRRRSYGGRRDDAKHEEQHEEQHEGERSTSTGWAGVVPVYDPATALTVGEEIAVEDLAALDPTRWHLILGAALRLIESRLARP